MHEVLIDRRHGVAGRSGLHGIELRVGRGHEHAQLLERRRRRARAGRERQRRGVVQKRDLRETIVQRRQQRVRAAAAHVVVHELRICGTNRDAPVHEVPEIRVGRDAKVRHLHEHAELEREEHGQACDDEAGPARRPMFQEPRRLRQASVGRARQDEHHERQQHEQRDV